MKFADLRETLISRVTNDEDSQPEAAIKFVLDHSLVYKLNLGYILEITVNGQAVLIGTQI